MKKQIILFLFIMVIPVFTYACITCDRHIQEGTYNSVFYVNLLRILTPFTALGLAVLGLSALATRRHQAFLTKYPNETFLTPVPLTAAATVLGIGVGGFIDGIVFIRYYNGMK